MQTNQTIARPSPEETGEAEPRLDLPGPAKRNRQRYRLAVMQRVLLAALVATSILPGHLTTAELQHGKAQQHEVPSCLLCEAYTRASAARSSPSPSSP